MLKTHSRPVENRPEEREPHSLPTLKADWVPVRRETASTDSLRSQYQAADPFPHIVVDDFFDKSDLFSLLKAWPAPDSSHWRHLESKAQIKYTTQTDKTLPKTIRDFLFYLNSSNMIDWLEEITGISGLIPDPHFDGAGPHMIARGGHLGLHTDYNRNRRLGLDRRLNMLLYLNPDWKEEWGGHLELWDSERLPGLGRPRLRPKSLRQRILPSFGRIVLFSTTDFTFHGHPEPLACPEGIFRRSIAMYYFTNGRPKEETWVPRGGQHTLFYPRPGTGDVEEQGLTKSVLRWTPEWALRGIRKIRETAKKF